MKFRSSRLLVGIFLAAFLLRMGYVLTQPAEFWDEDERVYLTMAQNLVAGEGLIYSPYRKVTFPSLFPLLLAGILGAGLPIFPAARVLQALLGAFSCLLIGGVARGGLCRAGEGGQPGGGGFPRCREILSSMMLLFRPVRALGPEPNRGRCPAGNGER